MSTQLQGAGEPESQKSIQDIISPFWQMSVEERQALPKDGAMQHDHYIYGWPKR